MEPKVNISALYAAMNASRIARGLSWRDVAAELSVSPSTLTRMAQGKRPDVDSFASMVAWVRLPAERFMREDAGPSQPSEPLVELVLALRSAQLQEQDARVLEDVLFATYQSLRANKEGAR